MIEIKCHMKTVCCIYILGMLDLQNSLDKRIIFVILFQQFEFLVFALKAPILTFISYFLLVKSLNIIGSFSLFCDISQEHFHAAFIYS